MMGSTLKALGSARHSEGEAALDVVEEEAEGLILLLDLTDQQLLELLAGYGLGVDDDQVRLTCLRVECRPVRDHDRWSWESPRSASGP